MMMGEKKSEQVGGLIIRSMSTLYVTWEWCVCVVLLFLFAIMTGLCGTPQGGVL